MPSDNHSVVLSVSGLVLSLSRRQLNKYPNTRLAQQFLHSKASSSTSHTLLTNDLAVRENVAKLHTASNINHESSTPKIHSGNTNVVVYFFNRNPLLFMHIVDFYKTGMLHFPHQYCWTTIADELEYWRIDRSYLADCCQKIYSDHKRRVEGFRDMQRIFGDDVRRFQSAVMSAENTGRFAGARKIITQFYNDPTSSKSIRVKAYFLFYIATVVVYLISYILQNEMDFRDLRSINDELMCNDFKIWLNETLIGGRTTVWQPKTNTTKYIGSTPKYVKYFISSPKVPFAVIDGICTLVFYVDLMLRYFGSVNARTFFSDSGHIMDCGCNVADLIAYALHVSNGTNFSCSIAVLVIYLLLEVSRVIRVMRLIQFTNRYNGIIVLILTLRASMRELLLLLSVLGAGVVVFGFLIYVAELGDSQNSRYDNFMIGFWWSMVTMTTLGYGEITPTTPAGYLIGSICAITGVIFVALQVPVIANKFNALYTYACDQQLREQWAKEQSITSGETGRTNFKDEKLPKSRFGSDLGMKSDNPVVEFKRQLNRIQAYHTPASASYLDTTTKTANPP